MVTLNSIPENGKMYPCEVAQLPGGQSVRITSVKTKRAVTVTLDQAVGETEAELVNSLLSSLYPCRIVSLHAHQMQSLLEMSKRGETTGEQVNVVSNRTNATVERKTAARTLVATEPQAGNEERNIKRLEGTVKRLAGGDLYMLIYDIPTVKNEECPNPSGLLWWYGFRLNLSCWVMPEKSLKSRKVQELLAHWEEHRIETHLIKYSEDQLEKIRDIARSKLAAEVKRAHTSLLTRIESAAKRLDEARAELESGEKVGKHSTPRERDALLAAHSNSVRATLSKSIEALEASVSCAQVFDETESTADLLHGLREAIASEAASFNILAKQRGVKGAPKVPTLSI